MRTKVKQRKNINKIAMKYRSVDISQWKRSIFTLPDNEIFECIRLKDFKVAIMHNWEDKITVSVAQQEEDGHTIEDEVHLTARDSHSRLALCREPVRCVSGGLNHSDGDIPANVSLTVKTGIAFDGQNIE